MTNPMPVSVKPPLFSKINLRLVVFLAAIGLPIGYIVYQYVQAATNKGIQTVGDAKLVDLKALGYFPFDERASTIKDVPPEYRALDGKKVILEGFQYSANSSADEINSFQFVYNIQKCCFGGPPKVQERVYTRLPNGTVPYYYGEMVRCTGTMHVNVHKNEAGLTDAVYTMDLDRVDRL